MIYKVTHVKGDVETVYLVEANSERKACGAVLDTLYERAHKLTWTPDQLRNDVFGLCAPLGEWTNYALCKQNGCSISATPYRPDPPQRLYALNRKTGEVS